jgi:hypothetical protein
MSTPSRRGLSRRAFLLGAAAGLGVGVPVTWHLARRFPAVPRSPGASTARSGLPSGEAMPGLYPGRVVEVRDREAVSPDNAIDGSAVARMVDRGMAELTGADPRDVRGAWRTFFQKGDVVGIKVNPVGRKPLPGEDRVANAVGSISSFALVEKVVRCLIDVGIPPRDIIVFERYANEFIDAGYATHVARELPKGVRWHTAALSYSNLQLDVGGRDPDCASLSPEAERRVVGYDPDVFTTMGYCMPDHSPRDDRRFRSHLSLVVSRMVNKMITLPVLKDHRSAGVTLALKNMSHGMNNNVCRSHLSGIAHGIGLGREGARAQPVQHLHPAGGGAATAARPGDVAHPGRADRRLRGRAGQLEQDLGDVAAPLAVLRHRPSGARPRRLGHHRRQARRAGLGAGGAHGAAVPDAGDAGGQRRGAAGGE